ncbi:hypothetical protein G4B88_012447 [Cannabis sativa]|uniref:TCP domain-containing protein n=1 Tax=Cannabis sativa TaxID=3483 RepID=A0A7J6I4Y7_CANSA|nr:hypothetical protein G4B88_012447 [Cannabis sativa]
MFSSHLLPIMTTGSTTPVPATTSTNYANGDNNYAFTATNLPSNNNKRFISKNKKQQIVGQKTKTTTNPRRRAGKKDRHSKISTAQGLRDRRMRLSLQIARKFFDLQDIKSADYESSVMMMMSNNNNNGSKSEDDFLGLLPAPWNWELINPTSPSFFFSSKPHYSFCDMNNKPELIMSSSTTTSTTQIIQERKPTSHFLMATTTSNTTTTRELENPSNSVSMAAAHHHHQSRGLNPRTLIAHIDQDRHEDPAVTSNPFHSAIQF